MYRYTGRLTVSHTYGFPAGLQVRPTISLHVLWNIGLEAPRSTGERFIGCGSYLQMATGSGLSTTCKLDQAMNLITHYCCVSLARLGFSFLRQIWIPSCMHVTCAWSGCQRLLGCPADHSLKLSLCHHVWQSCMWKLCHALHTSVIISNRRLTIYLKSQDMLFQLHGHLIDHEAHQEYKEEGKCSYRNA